MADRYSSEVLVVITATEWDNAPTQQVLHIALYGGMYTDPDNPSGAPIHWRGCIKSDVVFKKQIGIEFWKESSAIDFGYLDIALEDQDDIFIDWAKNVLVATVQFYRVNLSNPLSDQLEVVASARTSDIGFADEFRMRLRLESLLQEAFESQINEKYYGYEYPTLEGKAYPIAWGIFQDPYQILPTTEVDPTILLYHVTDIEIRDITGEVYDKGVPLYESYGEFTEQTYGFTLNQNPAGRITCGRIETKDPLDTGSDLLGLFRFVRLAMTRTGIWGYADQGDLTQLASDIGFGDLYPIFATDKPTSLESFLKTIFAGVTGWYYIDELAEVHFGRMTDPSAESAPPFIFTDTNMVGKIKVEDDKAPGLTRDLRYAYSPGAYDADEISGAVYGDERITITNEFYVISSAGFYRQLWWTADSETITADSDEVTADGYAGFLFQQPSVSAYWKRTETREPIRLPVSFTDGTPSSYFLAEQEITRWWSELYYKRRRFYTFDVQINDDQFNAGMPQLGDFCTLQSDRFKLIEDGLNLFIRRMSFNFSKNLLTIEGWG